VIAAVSAYALYFILSLVILRKIYPISYQWRRLFKIVFTGFVLYLVSDFLIGSKATLAVISLEWQEFYLWSTLKLLLLISYPFLLFLLRFYLPEEKSKFRYFATRLFPVRAKD
jgi:hypothetical protein